MVTKEKLVKRMMYLVKQWRKDASADKRSCSKQLEKLLKED